MSKPLYLIPTVRRLDNLGDEIIFLTLVSALQKSGVVRVKGVRNEFLGVQPDGGLFQSRVRRILQRISGGHIFHVSLPGGGVASKDPRKIPSARVGTPKVNRMLKRFLNEIPISLGRSWVEPVDVVSLSRYAWIGVRDDYSLRLLRGAGVRNAHYFPDLAFLVDVKSQERISQDARCDSPKVALSIREAIPGLDFKDGADDMFALPLKSLQSVFMDNCAGSVIQFFQVEEDEKFNRFLSEKNRFYFRGERLEKESCFGFYSDVDIVVSNRLHCLLFAAISGAIPLAFTVREHSKVVSLFHAVGWADLVIDCRDPIKARDGFERVKGGIEFYKTMVANSVAKQRAIGRNILDQMPWLDAGKSF